MLFRSAFDASFMQYFGLEGRDAVKEAFTVVNDFFSNSNYVGVSELELNNHGFRENYNTTWINQTAQNAQIIDIKLAEDILSAFLNAEFSIDEHFRRRVAKLTDMEIRAAKELLETN